MHIEINMNDYTSTDSTGYFRGKGLEVNGKNLVYKYFFPCPVTEFV